MSSLFTLRFDITRRDSNRDVLLVFSAVPIVDPETFATAIELEIEANLVPDELFIVVRSPHFNENRTSFQDDSLNQATLGRLRNRATVTLVGYDYTGSESDRITLAGPEPKRNVEFNDFKRRAVTAIFNARRGFVESTSTYHFENPSGRHTERFIRLSNILASGAEISFIGFCTLPYVPLDCSYAYLDTPSLYAVVAAINEQRASFADAQVILADNFSSYAGFEDFRFDKSDIAIVLISATSSGSLARRLIDERGFRSDQIVHVLLLGTDQSKSKTVCNLARNSRDNPNGIASFPLVEEARNCRICAAGSHAIKLQGDQFEIAGPQQDPLLVAKSHAPSGLAKMMERYAGLSIFEVGLGRSVGPTPRQFHVNPANLVSSPAFQERLEYLLRRSLPASLSHVIALDPGSESLAQTVAKFGGHAVVLGRDALDTIPQNTQTAVLIVGAVIESGRSMLDISRDLRSIAPNAPLFYMIGLSKTTGEPRRESLSRNLIETHNFFPYQVVEIERLILPTSSDTHAWTAELRLLVDPDVTALVPDALRSAIDARVTRLRNASDPLRDDLFLANAHQPLRLQPGFVFWPDGVPQRTHSQADVFFTISSVLQQLRANAHVSGKPAIKSNWFQQTILAPGNFGRFNDDIIQASIIRAAYPFEMNFADAVPESREMGRLIRRIIEACNHERGGAATEFLLALATERMRLCRTDLDVVLNANSGGVSMVAFMQSVCRLRLADSEPV